MVLPQCVRQRKLSERDPPFRIFLCFRGNVKVVLTVGKAEADLGYTRMVRIEACASFFDPPSVSMSFAK